MVKRKAELSDYLAELEPKYRKTVQWWIETDKVDRSNPLPQVAELYRREYLESLPGPGGRKAPSHIARELGLITKTIKRLQQQLGEGLSPEAGRRLRDKLKNTHLSGWLIPYSMANHYSPFAGRLFELEDLADSIQQLGGAKQRKPHHYWLIRWTSNRLRAGGKPRGHVLPIVQAIHRWASEGELVSEGFGEEYLDLAWPPIQVLTPLGGNTQRSEAEALDAALGFIPVEEFLENTKPRGPKKR